MQDQLFTENDLQVMFAALPEPPVPFFRLYHDDNGKPLFYSMEDLPGNYIEITQEQFARGSFMIRVVNNAIVPIKMQSSIKLTPSESGTACYPDNVAIVVPVNEPHQCWKQKTYDTY